MERLRWPTYVGYGAGDAANNLSFSMVTAFLALYYTDVIGLVAPAIATLIFVVRFWDAFCDLFAGQLVDRTMTRWGKFRPYLLFGAIPLLVSSVLCFTVPPGLSDGARLAWGYATYALMGLLYSIVNIPYGSLAAAMTQVPTERARLATFRTLGGFGTLVAITVVVAPQVERHHGNPAGLQEALTSITLAFVVIGTALYALTFATARERVERTEPRIPFRAALPVVLRNPPLLILCGSSLLMLTSMYMTQALGIYFARDVLGNAAHLQILTIAGAFGTLLLAPFAPLIVARFGKKRGYLGCGLLVVVGAVGAFLAPAQLVPAAVCWFFFQAGLAGVNMLMWALEADTVEFGQWRGGLRTEGLTYATFSFTRKMGQAVGGSIGIAVLGAVGYIAHQPLSPGTLLGIKAAATLVPAAFAAAGCLVMAFYPLTDARFSEILIELRARTTR